MPGAGRLRVIPCELIVDSVDCRKASLIAVKIQDRIECRVCAMPGSKLVAMDFHKRQEYRMRSQSRRSRSSKSLSNLSQVKAFVPRTGKKKWMPLI